MDRLVLNSSLQPVFSGSFGDIFFFYLVLHWLALMQQPLFLGSYNRRNVQNVHEIQTDLSRKTRDGCKRVFAGTFFHMFLILLLLLSAKHINTCYSSMKCEVLFYTFIDPKDVWMNLTSWMTSSGLLYCLYCFMP